MDQLKQSVLSRDSVGIGDGSGCSNTSSILTLVDERVKHYLQHEMKKVSQMLIQNLTVFVQ